MLLARRRRLVTSLATTVSVRRASAVSWVRTIRYTSSTTSKNTTAAVKLSASQLKQRSNFFRFIRARDWEGANNLYSRCAEHGCSDGRMLSELVRLTAERGDAQLRGPLLRSLWKGRPSNSLDAHLASSFISAFGQEANLRSARSVLDAAERTRVSNTRVRNAYLRACSRIVMDPSAAEEATRSATAQAQEILGMMHGRDEGEAGGVDAFTCSLAVGILSSAGQLREAVALVHETGDRADTVSYNALIDAAARAGDVQCALDTIDRMEAGQGPTPDLISYNSALKCLAHAPHGQLPSASIDRVAAALSIRRRMSHRGLEESNATRTALLTIFSDSPLAEVLMNDSPSLNDNLPADDDTIDETHGVATRAPSTVPNHPSNGRRDRAASIHVLRTDLRGLTRQAIALRLSVELQEAAALYESGLLSATAVQHRSWEIVTAVDNHGGGRPTGASARRYRGRAQRRPVQGATAAEASKVTVRTALEWMEAERIAVEQPRPGLLVVSAGDFLAAAKDAAARAQKQRMRQGMLLRLGVLISGLAAVSLVPRLIAL